MSPQLRHELDHAETSQRVGIILHKNSRDPLYILRKDKEDREFGMYDAEEESLGTKPVATIIVERDDADIEVAVKTSQCARNPSLLRSVITESVMESQAVDISSRLEPEEFKRFIGSLGSQAAVSTDANVMLFEVRINTESEEAPLQLTAD